MLPRSGAIRVAVRGLVMHEDRLLLVNAWADHRAALWCAPGGGAEAHSALPDNLAREIYEETGLRAEVGAVCLVNEFHNQARGFHQVEIFFRCTVADRSIDPEWRDPEGVVKSRVWVNRDEIADLTVKPSCLAEVAWQESDQTYDPLEPLLG